MNDIRFIDLFSGIGGFRLGLERANKISQYSELWVRDKSRQSSQYIESRGTCEGRSSISYRCVWSCDWSKYANKIYTQHFGEKNHHPNDIRRVNTKDIPDFDLLCSGFPCQAFSVAGKREGFRDTRGTLFFEICRIAEAKKPNWLLLENVRGLLSHDEGFTFQIILESLEELGYWIEWQILNSKYFGVPQNRERVFIIGHSRGTSSKPIFPIIKSSECINFGDAKKQVAYALQSPGHASGNYRGMNMISQALQTNGNLYQGSSWGTDNPQSSRVIRRLTPIECERLQGFPDGWTEGISDTQRYRVLGNAVTVNVIEFLGKRILSSITNMGDKEK